MTATHTRFDMKKPVLLSLISGVLLTAHPAAAADTVAVPKAGLDACLQTVDRLNRLDCFDKLLGTPISVLSGGWSPTTAPASSFHEKPPIAALAHAMEQARMAGDEGWQFRYSRVGSNDLLTLPELMAEAAAAPAAPPPPAENGALPEKSAAIYAAQNPGDLLQPGTANVYLTMPETPPADATGPADRAILMLSCEANITTARLILPQPLSLGPHTIEIRTASGRPETETWQAVADGAVLMNARGLTSIADITRWRTAPRIQLSLGIGNENRALLFEMGNLADILPPLRRACQW
ncbi:type VI secretion system-associated protein TagO [Martelella sp. FOR1707]